MSFVKSLKQTVGNSMASIHLSKGVAEIRPHVKTQTLGGTLNVPGGQDVNINVNNYSGRVVSLSQVQLPSNFGSPSTIEFKFNVDGVNSDILLHMDVTNGEGSGNNATFSAARLIQRVEFLSPASGNVISQISDPTILWALPNLGFQESGKRRELQHEDIDGDPLALADAAQIDLYVPLPNPFSQAGVFMNAIRGELVCRVYLNGDTAGTYVSGTDNGGTDLEINDMRLIIDSADQEESESMALRNRFKTEVHDFIWYEPVVQTFQQNMAASTDYTFNLSSIRGSSGFDIVLVRSLSTNPMSPTGWATTQAVDFELLDRDSHVVGIKMNDRMNRLLYNKGYQGLTKNVYVIDHAGDTGLTEQGVGTGQFFYSGQEVLRITTPSGLSTEDYEIMFIAHVRNVLTIGKDGSVKTTK